ncbi:MAG: hypothetical protein CMM01_09480 [Rhodopirellula sp.]|nr:hypothetical protein [Rhodopirellula sp.]OUX51499.1 MAG: hypothetical protein CBE43_03245 [Rhodopirellula sp. TMED283]
MSRFGLLIAFVCFFLGASPATYGQFSEQERDRLIGAIESTQSGFDAEKLPDVDAAKAELLGKVAAVESYFQRDNDEDNSEAWLQSLSLGPLKKAIQSSAADSAVLLEAKNLRDRLIGMTPGLELSAIRQLREAALHLSQAISFSSTKGKRVVSTLSALKKMISEVTAPLTTDQFAQINFFVGTIASSGQGDELVHAFREVFGKPNVAVLVGTPLLQKAVDRELTRQEPVRQTILGTRIVGTATMTGAVTAKLLPSTDSAKIELGFKAKFNSSNTGYNGPVRLMTTGTGDIDLVRTLNIDSSGFHLSGNKTDVELNTNIDAICHKMELVRKLAWKAARRQKPKADCIATQRLKQQVSRQFEEEASNLDIGSQSAFLADGETAFQRLSLTTPIHEWSSTEQMLAIDALFRAGHQLGSVDPRPTIDETFDVAIQIHESAVENACATVLAGRALNEKKLDELLGKIGRGVEDTAAKVEDDKEGELTDEEPFEIVFSQLRPIVFEARDQVVRVGVRGRRFTKGKRVLQKALEVTADYKPTTLENGIVVLKRDGKVKVDFGGRKLSISEAGMKPVIEKSFGKVFPDTILERAIKVAEDAKMESLRGLGFSPRLVQADDGWLTIAIR